MAKLADVIKNSLEIDTAKLQLENDAATPGNSKYYGTDGTGAKGFHALAEVPLLLNEQADSYTLVLTDAGKLIDMAKSTAQTLTVPKNSSVAFSVGTQILVRQKGAGQVTIAPVDVDVTLNSAGPALKTVDQYSVAGLIKVAENVWAVFGDLEA